MTNLHNHMHPALTGYYEFHNYGHALEILDAAFPEEWADIQEALRQFRLTKDDILKAGGNESPIPKKFDDVLYPRGWREIRIAGDLVLKLYPRQNAQRRGRFSSEPFEQDTITGEWNSKDQTFDRDLLAMRTYHECGLIDVGVIVTRSETLNAKFKEYGIMQKYGASTTWLGKLLYRLDSRRNGGCPILAVGIKKECVIDD